MRLCVGGDGDGDGDGSYFYNDARLIDAEITARLHSAATLDPQPELHICGDQNVRYGRVAVAIDRAMASARVAGLRKIRLVTEPEN